MTEQSQDKLRASLVRALQEVERLRKRIAAAEDAAHEPIAVIGVGLRMAGGILDLSTLWSALASEFDAVGPIPRSRWNAEEFYDPDPDRLGKSYVRHAAFMNSVDGFDPAFFNISPREAVAIDPQHRLLLETAWEALEQGGILPAALRETNTGVFVGVGPSDYARVAPDANEADAHGIMTHPAFAAGRIAFSLGLQGPALSLDTACSSSLTALHLACGALRAGECELALAGGVQVMAAPDTFMLLSRMRAVAPDGRSKTFSDFADGYGRGEGAIVVALERLSDARAKDRRVLALVRGSAINHDGPSSSITAPNGTSQQKVIRAALADARLQPSEVDVVECHGTGTALGDPIEVQALAAVYGEGRAPDEPLLIGAIKTNIGHLESAAGLAGVVKVIAAMRHGMLPATLHTQPRNRHLDWDSLPVEVVDHLRPWPQRGRPMRAGVSAFGLSGTNAHVILEAAEVRQSESACCEPSHVLPFVLSARTPDALVGQVERLASWLGDHRPGFVELAASLARTRSHFPRRVGFAVADFEGLLDELRAYTRGMGSARRAEGTALRPKLAGLFSGQGSQRLGMGIEVVARHPVARVAFDQIASHFDGGLQRPLWDVIGGGDASLLDRTEYAQPALFALEVALFRLFESWGVRGEVLLGHSIGEIAAAHVAGVFELEDACRVVAARARLMQGLAERGGMAALRASEAEVVALLERVPGLDIAGVNGPSAVVVSGDADALSTIIGHFEALGRKASRLAVSHAFHSRHMDGMLDEYRVVLRDVRFSRPRIALISNLTGALVGDEMSSPEYWVRQVREPVRFMAGVQTIEELGVTSMLEFGPQGTLLALASECLSERGRAMPMIASLRKDRAEDEALALALAALHVHGVEIDWQARFAGSGPAIEMPTYAFDRTRHWPDPRASVALAAASGLDSVGHPLLVASIPLADGSGVVFTGSISMREEPWLADHVVFDHVLFPGTGLLDLALFVGTQLGVPRVEEMAIATPLVLEPEYRLALQVVVGPAKQGRRRFDIYSRKLEAASWTSHASGALGVGGEVTGSLPSRAESASLPFDRDAVYERLATSGLAYGPSFRGLVRVWDGENGRQALVELPGELQVGGHVLHPALFDAALHALAFDGDGERVALPFAWTGVSINGSGVRQLVVRFRTLREGVFSLDIADSAGRLLGRVEGLSTRPATPASVRDAVARSSLDILHQVEWRNIALEVVGWTERTVVVGDPEFAARLGLEQVGALDELAAEVRVVLLPRFTATSASAATIALMEDLRAFVSRERPQHRLVVVTRGAVAGGLGGGIEDLADAPLWGLVRALRVESPDLDLAIIDVDEASLSLLAAALASGEEQIVLREGQAWIPRLMPLGLEGLVSRPFGARAWYLETPVRGTIDNLRMVAHDELLEPLGINQVRLEVRATGMNFRDVLNALGMYPGDPGPLGYEGSGVVVGLGEGVQGLALGDRVFGLLRAGFGSHSVIDRRFLTNMPAGWSFAEAAAVPLVYLTAYHALVELADVQPGERILIHAATGGVGIAAVQLARHLGAEVFATASASKWPTLRAMGLDELHVGNSRTLEFESRFRKATGGSGVDVVLDSLAREFVDASLRLLPRGGRFIELGKTDVRDPVEVARQHPGVRYRAFELSEVEPDGIAAMLGTLLELFEAGALSLPPIRCLDIRQAVDAFRFVGQARHIGKVVLRADRCIDPSGTVLITGGTGGLGAELARHLVGSGVRSLVLASRRGLSSPGAEALVEQLEANGGHVVCVACDIAVRSEVAALLERVPTEYPLTAVVHTAGVLEDGLLGTQTAARVEAVFRAKVEGAKHLDELTANHDLTAFVVYSSVAGILGNPGQSAYAAANSYLDALCDDRRRRGMPATSLAWGAWAGAGMAAGLTSADLERVRRQGTVPLEVEEGLRAFDAALSRPESLLVAVRLDREMLARRTPIPELLRGLVRAARTSEDSSRADGIVTTLRSMSTAERMDRMLGFVRREAATVLGFASSERVPVDRPLQDHGLDSLMAVELRNRLQAATDLRLPSTLLFDHSTTMALARYLLDALDLSDETSPVDDSDEVIRRRIASIPLSKLRESGLLSSLLELTGEQAQRTHVDEIDDLSVDDLISMALASEEE